MLKQNNMTKVKNMESKRGNTVANQFIIETDTGIFFQSYSTIIAKKQFFTGGESKIILDINNWNYSKTTSKYRNIFLNEDTATTKNKIASGEYILADLN